MSWKSIWKSFLDLLLISFFTMLASVITIIAKLVHSDEINLTEIYSDGCFFLYSISFFSSSLLYYLNKNENHFGKYSLMILISICAITYSQFINGQKSDTYFTKYGSLFFLLISFIFFLLTQYYQRLQLPDINQEDVNNQNIIVEGIDFN